MNASKVPNKKIQIHSFRRTMNAFMKAQEKDAFALTNPDLQVKDSQFKGQISFTAVTVHHLRGGPDVME